MTISAQKGGDFLTVQKGKITYIHGSPRFAKVTVAGTHNKIYVSPKLVNEYNLKLGDTVEFKSKAYAKGPSVTEFTKVRGVGVNSKPQRTQKPENRNRSNSNMGQQGGRAKKKGKIGSTLHKIKNRYSGQQGFLRRLFLVAMGGAKSNYSALESRAES